MLIFLLHIKTAWNDYFTEAYTKNLNSQTPTSTQTPSGTGVYVSKCLFISLTSSSSGGVLSCSSVTYLLVESSSFFSCKTSRNGGGIYFYNTNNGQCVLHEVCGYDCCTTNDYDIQFAYNTVSNTVSCKNYVNYSSTSRSFNEIAYSWYTLFLRSGKICYSSDNISMNKCYGQTVYSEPFSDSNSATCSFSYSTFADNIVTQYTCIYLATGGAKYEIKSCNILRNTQGVLGSEGTVYTNGNLNIEDSCILENKATNIFYQANTNYRTTISNCTVDSTSNNGYLTIQNTVTKSFILALNHISTRNCHSEYDSAGTLTPIIQTPSSSKKQIQCSCEKYICHIPQGNFISLTSIFIFNFIHFINQNHWY
jgi:hypothetical protein